MPRQELNVREEDEKVFKKNNGQLREKDVKFWQLTVFTCERQRVAASVLVVKTGTSWLG